MSEGGSRYLGAGERSYNPPRPRRLPTRTARNLKQKARREVWPAVLLFYATLAPPELSFTVGTLVFHAHRVLLLLLLPGVIKRVAEGRITLRAADFLVMFAGVWMLVATTINYDMMRAFESAGITSLELIVAYFVTRTSIRTPAALRAFLIAIAPGLFVAGTLIMIESFAGRYIFRPILASLTGNAGGKFGLAPGSYRVGFLRGMGLAAHPILGAVHLASFLPLYLMSGMNGWPKRTAVMGSLMSFFTFSSVGVMTLVLGVLMTSYDFVQRTTRVLSWRLALGVLGAVALVLHFGSKGGLISAMFRYLTFDPTTGYYRTLIWEFGSADVWRHPFTGIGFEEFTRPVWMLSPSVDAYWLLAGLQFGLPTAAPLFIAAVLAAFHAGTCAGNPLLKRSDQRLLVGLTISTSVLIFALFTVAVWGQTYSFFAMMIGIAAGIQTPPRARPMRTTREALRTEPHRA